MLDKRTLESFKRVLMEQRAALLAEATKTLRESCDDTQVPGGDFADIAAEESNRALRLRLREREQKLLAKIDESLAKIDKGVYGICESCGGDIGVDRLEARPVAKLCIDCKQEQESGEA
ncbi:MAG: RNA polymerase-binding protein DksA [Candidatus Coatesbacteria bacterium]|nr:RNA polymerase-binding protein DksA [Candidatus Coatesbacteria bacterium]